MTVARCGEIAAGHKYLGVEYGVECHFGNVISGSSQTAETGCEMGCGGKPAELCGGGNRMNVYQDTSYQSADDWVSLGCYIDSTEARALQYSYVDYSGMTIDICLAKANGYAYAGLEYYGECYWGNTLSASSEPASSGCDTHCAGNVNTNCGGGGRISLYRNNNITPTPPDVPTYTYTFTSEPATSSITSPDTTSPDTTSPDTTSPDSTSPGTTSPETTSPDTTSPGTTNPETTSPDTTSPEPTSPEPTSPKPTSPEPTSPEPTSPDTTAPGTTVPETTSPDVTSPETTSPDATTPGTTDHGTASTTTTPGSAEPTVNQGSHSYVYKGCWKDNVSWRSLDIGVTDDIHDGMTVEKCLSLASQRQVRYAGVEFGGECWIASQMDTVARQGSEQDCSSICTGNSLEICGGDSRLGLYENINFLVVPTKTEIFISTKEFKEAVAEVYAAIAALNAAIEAYLNDIEANAKLARRDLWDVVVTGVQVASTLSSINTTEEELEEAVAGIQETVQDITPASIASRNAAAKFVALNVGLALLEEHIVDLLRLFARIFGLDINTGNPTIPPPSTTLPPSDDPPATTSTSTSICSPAQTDVPRQYLILFNKGATTSQIGQFKGDISKDLRNYDIDYPTVDIRIHVAYLTRCEVKLVQNHDLVEAATPNKKLKFDKDDGDDILTPDPEPNHVRPRSSEGGNATLSESQKSKLEKRATWFNANLAASYPGGVYRRVDPHSADHDVPAEPIVANQLTWLNNVHGQTTRFGNFYDIGGFPQKQGARGAGVYVYVIEPDYLSYWHNDYRGQIITTFPDYSTWPTSASRRHGTCMASLIAGKWSGVAPEAKLIYVSTKAYIAMYDSDDDDDEDDKETIMAAGFARALGAVTENIKDEGREGVSVVSMSFSTEYIRDNEDNNNLWVSFFERMEACRVVCVTSAGNDAENGFTIEDSFPGNTGGVDSSLIVAGNAQYDNSPHSGSRLETGHTGILSIYTIGTDVYCAKPVGNNEAHSVGGTSPAAAITAGIIATMLSDPEEVAILNGMARDDEPGYTWGHRVKDRLRQLAVSAKGDFSATDNIPRAAAGTWIPCASNPENLRTSRNVLPAPPGLGEIYTIYEDDSYAASLSMIYANNGFMDGLGDEYLICIYR
ncbi:hypothetical protein ABW20_dc0104528 [Dactylellina cionopaga]|nr:hypothetical protein ABW20_dc0104528 [Dactylellina cionopaga]